MSPKSIQRVAAAAAASACSPLQGGGASSYAATNAATTNAPPPPCSYSAVSSPETANTEQYRDDMTARDDDDDDVAMGGDLPPDYAALADIEAFFQSPKCMEYGMMDPCSAFFAPAPMGTDWEEEGEIDLWSFSSLNN